MTAIKLNENKNTLLIDSIGTFISECVSHSNKKFSHYDFLLGFGLLPYAYELLRDIDVDQYELVTRTLGICTRLHMAPLRLEFMHLTDLFLNNCIDVTATGGYALMHSLKSPYAVFNCNRFIYKEADLPVIVDLLDMDGYLPCGPDSIETGLSGQLVTGVPENSMSFKKLKDSKSVYLKLINGEKLFPVLTAADGLFEEAEYIMLFGREAAVLPAAERILYHIYHAVRRFHDCRPNYLQNKELYLPGLRVFYEAAALMELPKAPGRDLLYKKAQFYGIKTEFETFMDMMHIIFPGLITVRSYEREIPQNQTQKNYLNKLVGFAEQL